MGELTLTPEMLSNLELGLLSPTEPRLRALIADARELERVLEQLEAVRAERDQLSAEVIRHCKTIDALRDRLAAYEGGGKCCEWSQDAAGDWHTNCGHLHQFTECGPVEHEHQWCPYCGGRLTLPGPREG